MLPAKSFIEDTTTLIGVRRDQLLRAPTTEQATEAVPATAVFRPDNDTLELSRREAVANLVVLTGRHSGTSQRLGADELIVGRSAGCQLVLEDEDVSRQHISIRKVVDGYTLTDMSSRNGTLLNGHPFTNGVMLEFGDRVTLGSDTILLFTHHDQLSELLLHRQRMEAIGRLAGGVAHDFNNLLGAILANVSALTSTAPARTATERAQLEALDDIRVAAARAAELTGQLLGFARRGKFQEVRVDVNALCEEAARLCRRAFGPNYKVETALEAELVMSGDPAQLQQAIMNVLINARDAMPTGGTVQIRARRCRGGQIVGMPSHAELVEISIKDHGVGMTADVCRRVFEPFFTTKDLGRGTGLGLATTYGVTETHGGNVRVESQPGKGSSFFIYLPLQPKSKVQEQGGDTREVAETGRAATLLIVDDEELCLRSLARVLKRAGHNVLTATTGKHALELYAEHREKIDLVLLDMMMPEMTGDELAARLTQIAPDVRFVIMSGYSDDAHMQQALRAGAKGFLRKPFDKEAVENTLQSLL